jgi:hypothetical protein
MGKLLLNLTSSEPFSPVKKLSCFGDPIELGILLVGSLHLGILDPIKFLPFNVVRIELCWGQVIEHIRSVQGRYKIWVKQFHIKYRVQAKERGNN